MDTTFSILPPLLQITDDTVIPVDAADGQTSRITAGQLKAWIAEQTEAAIAAALAAYVPVVTQDGTNKKFTLTLSASGGVKPVAIPET